MFVEEKKLGEVIAPFKSAKELGITERQRLALIDVLERLESGKIPPRLFTMRKVGRPGCGSAGCILGWAIAFSTVETFIHRTHDLECLFYPILCETAWDANSIQGAKALRSYLTMGKASWAKAMEIV